MPAAAVARRTPMIGGRAASAFGASGETGWDMRERAVEDTGQVPRRSYATLWSLRKALEANGRPARADGETSTLGERPSIGAGRAADHAAPGAGLAGRGMRALRFQAPPTVRSAGYSQTLI